MTEPRQSSLLAMVNHCRTESLHATAHCYVQILQQAADQYVRFRHPSFGLDMKKAQKCLECENSNALNCLGAEFLMR